jgi:hypothetical protein
MVENCYILYSCDGNYNPIVSNYSGLSAYSSSFVTIDVTDSSIPNDVCFYVLDIGVVDCDPTHPITGATSGCSCECYCYFIRSVSETTDVTYVNCDNEIVVQTINEGLTYNICSKVYPQFDTTTQIPIKLTDICQDGQCPPTIPTVKPTNECDVITIFPMGVTCNIQNPSNDKSFDGATEIIVTGGTPPYTIFWEVGSFAPVLTNLGVGEYTATVTDYYNDFSATTTCVLTADTLTISGMCFVLTGIVEDQLVYVSTDSLGLKNGKPYYQIQYGVDFYGYVFWSDLNSQWTFCSTLDCQTNDYSYLNSGSFYPSGNTGTWTSNTDVPTIIYESYIGKCLAPAPTLEPTDLCVVLTEQQTKTGPLSITQIELEPSDYINGFPSWTSVTNQWFIYWNTGSTPSQWTLTGYPNNTVVISNNDPSYPPVSNWQSFGTPAIKNIQVSAGPCPTSYEISVSAIPNDADCDSNGFITVQAAGGVVPYQYSIDGGLTYQSSPIFNNLVPGTYNIFVQDSNNVTASLSNVVIGTTPSVSYTATLSVNYSTNTFTLTAPTMPAGVVLGVDLVMISTFSYYPTTLSPVPTYDNFATVNTVGQIPIYTSPVVNTYPLGGGCSPNTVTQIQNTYLTNIGLTSNQVYTGFITNNIVNNPTSECSNATGYYQLTIENARCLGLSCCDGNVINTVPTTPVVIL